MAVAKCSQCGIELEKISYVMPNWRPTICKDWEGWMSRPPLCKECWEKEHKIRVEKGK